MELITVDILRSTAGVPSFSSDTAQLAINGTANVYTHTQKISDVSGLVLGAVATVGSGTADMDLYLEQGPWEPASQGAAGTVADGWLQIGNKVADVIANNTWYWTTLSPVVLPYLRILVDGQGSNPSTAKIGLALGRQAFYI